MRSYSVQVILWKEHTLFAAVTSYIDSTHDKLARGAIFISLFHRWKERYIGFLIY